MLEEEQPGEGVARGEEQGEARSGMSLRREAGLTFPSDSVSLASPCSGLWPGSSLRARVCFRESKPQSFKVK